ncbi:MAG: MoaD/ThiS family protein [Peptococcaceae bacterium]|nr:MoaD/ThiS family protein [Peptococcaceae bacterium]
MRVVIRRDNTVKEIKGRHTVGKVLKMLEINPETVLVIKDGQLVPRDTVVEEDGEIEILPVVSGG